MNNNETEMSQSDRFLKDYHILRQNVKHGFEIKDYHYFNISESTARRILNGKQFDILTLIEMAAFVKYDVELFYCKKS